MKILVVSCSLNPDSSSFALAQQVSSDLRAAGAEVEFVDLREHALPICDGQTCTNPSVDELTGCIESADAVLLAAPIYNYDVNAAAKNLVEHTGSAWEGKIVGFLAAAGGYGSYMSLMPLANSLMLDFRCLIVPRFVYATGADFADGRVSSAKVAGRITQLANETLRLARALRPSHTAAANDIA
ncbi:MAG TPA: NAD(P)H-dependent oxidoreductase [Tepidisphaeraceae bacterium]|nr:NAD(P)H-dependent oxidoreductase [Tepidisphaeraceae bacterium]